MNKIKIICEEQLAMVTGGATNGNLTPDGIDHGGLGIDEVLNEKNYDWVADKIVELMNRNNKNSSYANRSRAVNNNVNIYDF